MIWLAGQQKVPPSPGLTMISIIIIDMIVKLLIISSISTISFIHICNMNDINNIVRIYHNGGAIMVSAYMLLISFMLQIWMKLMVLMLLMMSNLTIMTMMMILMMLRPGEGGTFCWLAGQPAGQLIKLKVKSIGYKVIFSVRRFEKYVFCSTSILAREGVFFKLLLELSRPG